MKNQLSTSYVSAPCSSTLHELFIRKIKPLALRNKLSASDKTDVIEVLHFPPERMLSQLHKMYGPVVLISIFNHAVLVLALGSSALVQSRAALLLFRTMIAKELITAVHQSHRLSEYCMLV